jgi:hypothetical protein
MLSLWFRNTASANRLKFTPFSEKRPKKLVSAEEIVDIKKNHNGLPLFGHEQFFPHDHYEHVKKPM